MKEARANVLTAGYEADKKQTLKKKEDHKSKRDKRSMQNYAVYEQVAKKGDERQQQPLSKLEMEIKQGLPERDESAQERGKRVERELEEWV